MGHIKIGSWCVGSVRIPRGRKGCQQFSKC
jgi:hypothetical protein